MYEDAQGDEDNHVGEDAAASAPAESSQSSEPAASVTQSIIIETAEVGVQAFASKEKPTFAD